MYAIEFNNGPNIEKMIATARQIRTYGKRYEGISVKVESGGCMRKRKGSTLIIMGNISRTQVKEIMRKCDEQYHVKYKIISNPHI